MNYSRLIKISVRNLLICCFLFSLAGCEQFWQVFDKQIITDYNEQLEKANKIMEGHDKLVNSINLNVSNITKQKKIVHEYLVEEVNWLLSLRNFQQFLESNEKRIRRVGINPDYVRDNVVNAIKMMQQNEINFRRALAVQDVLQPFLQRYNR